MESPVLRVTSDGSCHKPYSLLRSLQVEAWGAKLDEAVVVVRRRIRTDTGVDSYKVSCRLPFSKPTVVTVHKSNCSIASRCTTAMTCCSLGGTSKSSMTTLKCAWK
jgi:hypothetical protein